MNWKIKEVVLLVVLSVACGVVYLGWSTLWLPISGLVGPVGAEFMFGIWVIASPIIAYIIRKPGAALIAEVAAAAVELFTGSHFGLGALLIGIFQGIGSEIAFAIFRYKKYNALVLMLSGAFAGIVSMVYAVIAYGFNYYTTGVLIATLVIRIVSGMLLGGLLGKVIVDVIAKTGALNQFAIKQQQRNKDDQNDFVVRM
ncbi:ECF transporter S component [Niallia sp. 01092]|uniref:ECF transporter S component n=1 Tax=unclassified Niallia TaxID=2837522 RepID=UPI003FD406CA